MKAKTMEKQSANVLMNRTAIDSSGRLGSLYNACRDELLGELNVKKNPIISHVRDVQHCRILNEFKQTSRNNFLKLIEIEENLRLTMLLSVEQKNSIGTMVDYSDAINEYTRILHYTYVHRIEKLPDTREDAQEFIQAEISETNATHIVTAVSWGTVVAVILQLPFDEELRRKIDEMLERIKTFLRDEDDDFIWNSDEENLIGNIRNTMVYSTISDIQSCTSLQEICRYIQQNKNSTVDRPVSYILRPINWLYPSYRETGTKFTVPLSELNQKIEEHLFYIKANIAKMETSLKEEIPKLSCGYLRNYIDNFRKQVSGVKVKYTSMIQQLHKLLVYVRSGRISMSKLEEELKNNEQISVKNLCTDLIRQLDGLKSKVNFITELDQLKFVYVDVCERGIDSADKERTIQQKLIQTGNTDRIICSTDALNKKYAKQLKKHRENLVEEHRNNPNKRLIYADFSYSSYDLREIIVLPLNQEQNENKRGQQTTSISSREILNLKPVDTKKQTVIQETRTFASFETTGTFISPPRKSESITSLCQSSVKLTDHEELSNKASHRTSPTAVPQSIRSSSIESKDHDTITILLIGETGVGKSSFINAFANYLRFHTLDNAQSNQPLVLIPVSFIITVGDTFVERTVKFGDVNNSKNEDFNHPGQSVTQRCKSYEFEYQINDTVGKKIRIIDTPGFGDTRGIEQDDRNMKEIFNYAKTLSHVNAVCVLLKPNETRLNIFFRSCLTQLFTVLGPNISNNISFCFTNSRSTFYTPGNTAPLLKKMLASLSMGNTLFKKENTFCFDSESFRYLVARKNNITFSADQKKEYDMSWTISRKEANRLIHYICNNLTTYRL